MFKNKKTIPFGGAFLLLVVLINVLIIRAAFIHSDDFYWALLFSFPLMVVAIYYKRIVSKKETREKKIKNNVAEFNGRDIVILPRKIKDDELTVLFGNSHCAQPYLSSIICVESVSADQNIKFMPKQITLSEDNDYTDGMIQRLNDDLFIDDSIWTIGPDYAGCRDNNFKFNSEAFKVNALNPNVKMIELKLSGFNEKENISASKNFYPGKVYNNKYIVINNKSICEHTAFSNPESMVIFLDSLRQLSGKKPIGIRLPITDKKEFHKTCFAFCKTGIIPDYIVIEDYDKQSNFVLNHSQNSVLPLYEALIFVSKTLEIYALSKEIKIIAASEIYSPFDVLRLVALGADAVSFQNRLHRSDKFYETDGIKSTAFSQGCTEQLRNEILDSTMNIMKAWGYKNVREITLAAFFRDLDALYLKGFYQRNDQGFANSYEKRSYSIVGKSFHEKNTGSEVILN